MKLRSTAIALGVAAATFTGLSLLKVNKQYIINSTAVVLSCGLILSARKNTFRKGIMEVPKIPLVGEDLLAKIKELGNEAGRSDCARACGYVFTSEYGEEELDLVTFTEEMLKAKGCEGVVLRPLEGQKLLDKVNEIGEIDLTLGIADLVKEMDKFGYAYSGYHGYKRLYCIDFYEALLEAEGVVDELRGIESSSDNSARKDSKNSKFTAKEYFELGNNKLESDDIKDAIKAYTKAIILDENFSDAYYKRGSCMEKIYALDDAMDEYSKAIETNPNNTDAFCRRGSLCSDYEEYEEALYNLNKAIELDAKHANSYYERGRVKEDLDEYKEALSDYSKAIELGKDGIYSAIGDMKNKLEDYQGAITAYQKSIDLSLPNQWQRKLFSYGKLAEIKENLGDYQGAIFDLDQIINLRPDLHSYYKERGDLKNKVGDVDGACQDWKVVFESNDGDEEATDSFKTYCSEIIQKEYYGEFHSDDSEMYNKRGDLKSKLKDYQGAIEDYTKAIQIDKNSSNAYENRGTSQLQIGNYQDAIDDYNKAIEINPNSSQSYSLRGITKKEQGDYQGAIDDQTKSIELDPNISIRYYLRASAKIKLGDVKGAKEEIDKLHDLGLEENADREELLGVIQAIERLLE